MMLANKILKSRNTLSTRTKLPRTTLQTLPRNSRIALINRNGNAGRCSQHDTAGEDAGEAELIGFG
jgi:hypothetical protein